MEFHVVTKILSSAARQSGNFRQMVNDTYRSYRTKIPHQNFRNFFINGKQPLFPYLIHDTHHLYTRLRTDGIVAMSRGFLGDKHERNHS